MYILVEICQLRKVAQKTLNTKLPKQCHGSENLSISLEIDNFKYSAISTLKK